MNLQTPTTIDPPHETASLVDRVADARQRLDAWTREVVQWHFDPQTGCPFWLDYAARLDWDPREEIRKVRVPILVVGGDNDLQVPPDNAEALAKAQPRARKAIIAGMTHPLKKCTGRMRIDQTGAYGDSTLPIDPDLVAVVTQFIRGL